MRRMVYSVAVAAIAFFGLGQRAQAQSLDLSSSVQAFCVGDCSTVIFSLDVDGDVFVSNVAFQSDGAIWTFGGLLDVLDTTFNSVPGWVGTLNGNDLVLNTSSPQFFPSADPLHFVVAMGQTGTQDQLAGNIEYFAGGYTELDAWGVGVEASRFSTQGTVTPEPVTSILLGTGLAGIALMARRRRRDSEVESDEA